MNAKKITKVLKEIEESTLLVDYLLASGIDFERLCACLSLECRECNTNDQSLFSERKVREAKEWRNGNNG